MVKITFHGYARGQQRCGLNTKDFETLVEEAHLLGLTQMECEGQLGRFVDSIINKRKLMGVNTHVRLWQSFLFIFSEDFTLITVYKVQPQLQPRLEHQIYLKQLKWNQSAFKFYMPAMIPWKTPLAHTITIAY